MPRKKMTQEEKDERYRKKAEEQRLKNLESELSNLRNRQEIMPTAPNIFYKVGDRVEYGNIKRSDITEVLDEGKILKLHEICTDNNYGCPYDYERDRYIAWHDVVPYNENRNDAEQLSYRDEMHLSFYQSTLSGLTLTYYSGVDMSPEYQRDLVWTDDQKVDLIRSIFNNVDIGKFVLISLPFESGKANYEILDGKQRLNAIIEFQENRFKYRGKYYKELCWRDIDHLRDYSINLAMAENLTKEQKLRYFLKLNVTGVPQSQDHMNKIQEMWEKEVTVI